MSNYRRERMPGGTYFFTVTLANRRSTVLTDAIQLLRRAYGTTANHMPFQTIAICVLPNHLHAVWRLPEGDSAYARRWSSIKVGFQEDCRLRLM